ncbi:hypothetical protein B0H13DRAFT_2278556 [Mycena leptocephala]|nr:hypothetical protein B0H13DRAFT_2278556 [Mycena leptocephala]
MRSVPVTRAVGDGCMSGHGRRAWKCGSPVMCQLAPAMTFEPTYSAPAVGPDQETITSFWKRIAYLTARIRSTDRGWVGSSELVLWNSMNPQCRRSKIACDRKQRFLFECTKDEYFGSKEQFLFVYNKRDRRCRSFKKTITKSRRSSARFLRQEDTVGYEPTNPAIAALRTALADHERLRKQLRKLARAA